MESQFSEEEIKRAKAHPLFETAKEFWFSPWGTEAIKKSKDLARDKERNDNKLQEGSGQREADSQ